MFKNYTHTVSPKTDQERILDLLAESEYVFHLTGSRFFKTHTSLSDWDFFVQDDFRKGGLIVGTIRQFLYKNQFALMPKSDYLSTAQGINDVYQHLAANVQIQVIVDAGKKEKIQASILKNDNLMQIIKMRNKDRIKGMWETLYSLPSIDENSREVPVNKISMIEAVKDFSGAGLKESKDFVEQVLVPHFIGEEPTMKVKIPRFCWTI